MTEDDVIYDARHNLGEMSATTLLDALEAHYMHGFHDDACGDAEIYGHFYRVNRWIVWTDSAGHHDLDQFESEEMARAWFKKCQAEYEIETVADEED